MIQVAFAFPFCCINTLLYNRNAGFHFPNTFYQINPETVLRKCDARKHFFPLSLSNYPSTFIRSELWILSQLIFSCFFLSKEKKVLEYLFYLWQSQQNVFQMSLQNSSHEDGLMCHLMYFILIITVIYACKQIIVNAHFHRNACMDCMYEFRL